VRYFGHQYSSRGSSIPKACRQCRKDKVGKIPEQCQLLFERLQCDGQSWLDWVKNFRQRFRNEVGRPTSRQAFKTDYTVRRLATA
jgi:archaellum biogenesis protein FlaJ (TadC family)